MTCIDFIYDVNWRHEFPACTNGGVKYRTFREAVERFPKLRKINILLEKVKNTSSKKNTAQPDFDVNFQLKKSAVLDPPH